MAEFNCAVSVVEPLNAPCMGDQNPVFIKRDDLIHPIVSGNKWRKLKYHIETARQEGKNHLVTYGGAYSNHLIATACAGATLGFKTTAFVRGEELNAQSNFYLKLADLYGMNLIPVNRSVYRDSKLELFEDRFSAESHCYCIDEGGAGALGEKGVAEIISELSFEPDYLIHASATATTAAGLLTGLQNNAFSKTVLMPVTVMKNAGEQKEKLESLSLNQPFELLTEFDCGGYAKTSNELMLFIREFISQTGILIDPVYTGKALFALKEMMRLKKIKEGKKVVFLHTGGMTGLFSEKFLNATD